MCGWRSERRIPFFRKFLQHLDYPGPSVGVILARNRQVAESAMRDFDMRAASLLAEFPPDKRTARGIVVPVGVPGIGKHARWIEFGNVSVANKFAHAVDLDRSFVGREAVGAVDAGVHLPRFCRT